MAILTDCDMAPTHTFIVLAVPFKSGHFLPSLSKHCLDQVVVENATGGQGERELKQIEHSQQ